MKKIIDVISAEVMSAFEKKGYDANYGKVTLSNRPDLCEYQCNGALAAAKVYKKAPFMISDEVAEELKTNSMFESVESVKPGFLNIVLSGEFVKNYISEMESNKKYGVEDVADERTVMLDFGGPNVAKPLHVGHLRSAIIGESVKRILRYKGDKVIGDVHLGDWGLQMGLIITELKLRKPELVYFDDSYTGEYPAEAPFTIAELEEIYPTASAKSKEDPEYKEAALKATVEVQKGKPGYRALLNHILNVSVTDLKKNYENLNVSFDLWKGESDADPYIPEMVEMMKKEGFAYESDGALVVDVKEETDTKEIPPCMILKSDGAALYDTTDLATLVWRERDYKPNEVIYVVDKRQELHFIQVFRCAKKTGIVNKDTKLTFLGFGTMNGKDGKPFKTREGGVMRLEHLLASINEEMLNKISENNTMDGEEAKNTAKTVALAAVKYGDLSNQASKDYIFDIDRFTSFEGNTGPYILYTIVRIKSILSKYKESGKEIVKGALLSPKTDSEKELMLSLTKYAPAIDAAYAELAPHKICAYIYELSNALNHFYHETKIMGEEDEERQASYIGLLELTRGVLETAIDLLGFSAPDRM